MGFWNRITNTFGGKQRLAADVSDEIAFHIEERTRENLARGMSEREARAEARRRFGNRTRLEEETREADSVEWIMALVRDSRLAWRSLSKRPALAATAVLSLALGIGATSAIFSVVDAVVLKPLPLPDPGQLVLIQESSNRDRMGANPARLKDWRAQTRSFAALAGTYGERTVMQAEGAGAEFVEVNRTFGPALQVLGLKPLLGRAFTEAEERAEGTPVAVLSHAFWQRRFGGDPQILSRSLTLGGKPFQVIGILPPMSYPPDLDIWLAAEAGFQNQGRTGNWFAMIGRLKDGVTPAAAQPEIDTVASRLRSAYPDTDKGLSARVIPLEEFVSGEAREPLYILLATVGFVLLVACLNIASLLSARALERQRESAVRMSLGASAGSVVRLYLIESLWLAGGGAITGLLAAAFLIEILKKALPAELPRVESVTLDWRVAGFAIVLSLLCGIVFGVIPAWQAVRGKVIEGLRDGGRSSSAGASKLWIRRGLVAGQVAFSLLLLVAAALLARSFVAMQRSELGFRAQNVLTVSLHSSWGTENSKLQSLYARSLEAFAALPGVQSVGVIDRLPLRGGTQTQPLLIAGRDLSPELRDSPVGRRMASTGYFAATGVPLRRGRLFADRADGPLEVVVNESLARRYFPGSDPVGQRISFDKSSRAGGPRYLEIVGVVGDVRQNAQKEQTAPPEVYTSYQRTYWPLAEFVLRVDGDPRNLITAARETAARVEPDLPVRKIETLEAVVADSYTEPRLHSWLLGGFALTALLLAAVGLYGVLASDVSQRTREFGIRLALGADPLEISKLTLRRGLGVTLLGLIAGIAGAFALSRFLKSLLYGVDAADPFSFGVAIAALLLVAVLACGIPSRRAARVDPVTALRHE